MSKMPADLEFNKIDIQDLSLDEIDLVNGGLSSETAAGLAILGAGILVGAGLGVGVGAVALIVAITIRANE